MYWFLAAALAAPWNTDDQGVVLGGWDPVSYVDGRPAKGSPEHSVQWDGAVWHFASEAHRLQFQRSPERYAPAFGGWCAFGFAMDPAETGWPVGPYPVDPQTYIVQDDRVLLFHDSREFHAKARWSGDTDALLLRADTAWDQWSAGRRAVAAPSTGD